MIIIEICFAKEVRICTINQNTKVKDHQKTSNEYNVVIQIL